MKKYFKIIIVLLLLFSTPVYASSKDLFRAGANISVNEELDGSSFIAGETVDVESNVNGSLFSAGNSVDVEGKSDYLFLAGNSIRVDGVDTKDAFIAGNIVNLISGTISRDVYAVGSSVELNMNVERDAFLYGSTVKINGVVKGNLTVSAENIVVGDNASISGTLKYPKKSNLTISDKASIGSKKEYKVNSISNGGKNLFVSLLFSIVISLSNYLLFGIVLLVFMPKMFDKIKEMKADSILSNLGFGLISLFFIPIATFILMFTLIGFSVGLVLLILYFIAVYMSTIVTGYFVSNLIFKDKITSNFGKLTLGILIILVLKYIPFINVLVSIGSLCLGLGMIISLVFKRK